MSATRAAMVAGACAVLAGWSADARAELHRFAFRGHVGDIPAPMVASPWWVGIAPGDPLYISCVIDTVDPVRALPELDAARFVSVSMIIGGRLETSDGQGSTIRAVLEEGIARAGAAGHRVEFDLVLPSGIRVVVSYPAEGGVASWHIGDTTGAVRLASLDRGVNVHPADAPLPLPPSPGVQNGKGGEAEEEAIRTPMPGTLAIAVPAILAFAHRGRRQEKSGR